MNRICEEPLSVMSLEQTALLCSELCEKSAADKLKK